MLLSVCNTSFVHYTTNIIMLKIPQRRFLPIAIFGIVILLFAFSQKSLTTESEYTSNYYSEINKAFIDLAEASENFRNDKIEPDSLRKVFLEARKSYKKAEFILAFFHPEYVSESINGAPLLHLEKENSRPLVANPVGLQVLDELIYSDEIQEEKNEIANLARRLKDSYAVLYEKINLQTVNPRYTIVAMRLQLVRIFSMGITGFDTPGSLNSIDDAIASLEGMRDFLKDNNPKKSDHILELMDQTMAYLKEGQSFESLDRLELLKKYIDPLYKSLGKVQGKVDSELLSNTTSWNPNSTSIFAADFLNPYFFTELEKEEDTSDLRNLGEELFYDPLVSSDGKMSCASCHQPEKGFADGVSKSVSNVKGKTVLRNAPSLLNSVYADRYFYDLRAFTLEQQAEHVIFNADEFNTAYNILLQKIDKQPTYRAKFEKVFGKKSINRKNFSKALTSYVLSLKSFNSEFDQYIRGEKEQISDEVKKGFNLFMGKANCATCHFAPTFSGLVPPLFNENESEILGVLEAPNSVRLDGDQGRYSNKIGSENAWIYEKSFKTTTVRNAALTAPYFHNGAYETLEEVIEFYEKGGGAGIGLHVQNQTLSADVLGLTELEKKQLISFLKSLTDNPY